MKDFEGKYAVITGATSGICADAARMMAERGLAGIVIIGRNGERAKKVVADCKEKGCDAFYSLCDVADTKQIEATLDYIDQVLPRVDVLVNGSAISPYDQPWDKESVEHWDMIIDTNLRSQFLFCQAIGRKMISQEYGRIVNFSSCVARAGSGLSISYAASKAGILGLTRSFAKAFGKYNVTVNALLPGVIETPMLGDHDYSEAAKAWPMGRCGRPEELSEVVLFLASDKASYLCGTGIDANGGYIFS